jgi:hypothetical protein
MVAWCREMGWLAEDEGLVEAMGHGLSCGGCGSVSPNPWSAECWIWQCCVEARHLTHCSECHEFACLGLLEWAAQSRRFSDALHRLRAMHTADPAAAATEAGEPPGIEDPPLPRR